MTLFQLLMLGASAFFAYKIYEHIQTLEDPKEEEKKSDIPREVLIDKADEAMQKGDLQKALAIYSEANIKEPNDPETLFKMGYTLAQQDRDEEALEYYKEALALDADNSYIHQAMASLYRKMHLFEEAKKHLEKSLEIDANNPITYFNYGNLLVDMKDFDGAKKMYENALRLDATMTEAKEELEKLTKEV